MSYTPFRQTAALRPSGMALLCAALLLCLGAPYGAAPPQTAPVRRVTTSTGEWPAYNGDVRGSRYTPLDQINASNFNDLEVAWRFKTDNLGSRPEYKLEGTPLMVKGVLYATGGTRRSVFALDAASGRRIATSNRRRSMD